MMEETGASNSGGHSSVLEYCRGLPLYKTFLAGGATATEAEVANQILAPLMAQVVSRHFSKDSPKGPGIFTDATRGSKGKQAAQPDVDSLGEKAEVWEAGAVAYELLVGQPPTAVPAAPPTAGGLVRQTSFLGFLGFLSDDCVDFLQAVLREDAQERPTAAESLRHPWVRLHTAKQQASDKAGPALSPSAGSPSLRIRTPGVGTFASPSHSLSPAMATWKIPARAGDSRPGSGSSASDAGQQPPSPLHRTLASQDSEEEAEDVYPRTPLPQEGGFLASKRSTSLSHVNDKFTGEEYGETQSSIDPLLRRTYSVGKSRFA